MFACVGIECYLLMMDKENAIIIWTKINIASKNIS